MITAFTSEGASILSITDVPEISVTDVIGGKLVTIESSENATVYYTLDNSEPTSKSNVYEESFLIPQEGEYVVKAIAIVRGYDESYTAKKIVNVIKMPSPLSSLESGLVEKNENIELYSTIDGSRILYTLDNTTPAMNSDVYFSSIVINGFTWVKAIAVKEGYANSDVAIYNYAYEFAVPKPETQEATLVSKKSAVLNGNIKNNDELGFYDAKFILCK